MQLFRRGKALFRAFRLPLGVDAEQIRTVVPEEICIHTGGALHRRRKLQMPHDRFSLFVRRLQGQNTQHLPCRVQLQRILHARFRPANLSDLATRTKRLVIGGQSL